MGNLNLKIITGNIFKLLDYSGITDLDFANLLDISEKQLRLIKKGDAQFNIDNINKSCDFFRVALNKINSNEIDIDNDYREVLANKNRYKPEYYMLLESRPSIRHAIRFTLLHDSDFKSIGLVTGEIRDLFLRKDWDFTSRYISTSMTRNADLVEIIGKRIVKGKKANVYSAKK